MWSIPARLRSLFRGVRQSDTLADAMEAEFRLHIEMRTEDLVRSGMTPVEAARRARLEFGSTESFKDRGREARGLRWFDSLRVSVLDVKLGGRMLVKHPGLTVVGTIAVDATTSTRSDTAAMRRSAFTAATCPDATDTGMVSASKPSRAATIVYEPGARFSKRNAPSPSET